MIQLRKLDGGNMCTVLYVSDAPYNDVIDKALEQTFGSRASIIKLSFLKTLEHHPLRKLEQVIQEKRVIAIATDLPLPILETFMISRFDLDILIYTPVYRLDEFGWPKKTRLHGSTREVLDIERFEELTQLLAHYDRPVLTKQPALEKQAA